MSAEVAADRVRVLMERIADAAGVEADVEIDGGDGGLYAEFVGDDLAVLIGRHGQTIDAIQHLAYRIASRGDEDRVPVVVDAAGYRERRAETLRRTADHAAETALRDGRSVSLEAMNALERKVIHEHLKDRRDLETYSRGQEPARHLVVAPVIED
jgi:spoIIIJ-associated protein